MWSISASVEAASSNEALLSVFRQWRGRKDIVSWGKINKYGRSRVWYEYIITVSTCTSGFLYHHVLRAIASDERKEVIHPQDIIVRKLSSIDIWKYTIFVNEIDLAERWIEYVRQITKPHFFRFDSNERKYRSRYIFIESSEPVTRSIAQWHRSCSIRRREWYRSS